MTTTTTATKPRTIHNELQTVLGMLDNGILHNQRHLQPALAQKLKAIAGRIQDCAVRLANTGATIGNARTVDAVDRAGRDAVLTVQLAMHHLGLIDLDGDSF